MPKLWPANLDAVLVTRQVTDSITTISVPFWRFGFIKFGARTTITKLQNGGLVVFSPIPLSDGVSKTVGQLGNNVRYLVAPDMEHHINLGDWKKAYPSAQVIAPHDVREQRAKSNKEDVTIDYGLTASNKRTMEWPADFKSEFDVEFFDGHGSKEVVLLHRPSKAMIEADLLFNIPANEQFSKSDQSGSSGILIKLWSNIASLGIGQQRFIWYGLSAPNKPSFNESSARVAAWDFDKIIPCHGDVIDDNAKGKFLKLFQWHLDAAKAQK